MTSPAEPTGGDRSASDVPPRAAVVGTGLIGASLGLALRNRGWHVTGSDLDADRADQALRLGALDAVGHDPDAEITFVATPVSAIAAEAKAALTRGGVVTDVGSVKGAVVEAVADPRFVGGHPMAGSEQEGVDGADGGLFDGATWVLTPTADTDPTALTRVRTVVSSLGADVVALTPDRHDRLVAMVSHVPHLTAATLMALATEGAEEHVALLRLAAGGFRDMTRVAAGHPGIWPDICTDNRVAIVEGLDRLSAALQTTRELVASGDRDGLLDALQRARAARVNLPTTWAQPERLVEIRVPVEDRPGVAAEVTTLCSALDVNIEDLEIAHSTEGRHGVLILLVEAGSAEKVRTALQERAFRPSLRPLS